MNNAIIPRPAEPLVAQNLFRTQVYKSQAVPLFAEARPYLPEPILPQHEAWVALYWRAWELAWTSLRHPAPGSRLVANYIATAKETPLTMWDAVFMTQFGLYGRRAFNFMGTLNNFYARQHEDGFICRVIDMQTGHDLHHPFDPDGTGPNLLALAEWRYFRLTGDDGRLADVFWPLVAYHNWCRDNRTWPTGMYWATGVSSHMDNQPRVPNSRNHHRHWTWADATIQAAISCLSLAQIAHHLGQDEMAVVFNEEYTHLGDLINQHLWDEESQFYVDVSANGRFSRVKSGGAYWVLLANGLAPRKHRKALVQALRENWAFNLPHRIPSLSADSEGYNADGGNRWRGGVWPTTNYMTLRGLRQIGKHTFAHSIAMNHMQHVYDVYEQTGYLWDNYAPETTAAGEPARRNDTTSCITPIAMLLEDVIGLAVDWPHRRVYWDRRLESEAAYGIRNYPLGPVGKLDILADPNRVQLTTDVPFTLIVQDANQKLQTAVATGTSEIDLT
ncbi:MAG: glycoside hydrolase [Chloroflexi bacterium]|nr:glycoside hydrolase [Chloroflexota bacterium]